MRSLFPCVGLRVTGVLFSKYEVHSVTQSESDVLPFCLFELI